MQRFKYAEILLPLALAKKYTYAIPENLDSNIQIGYRVLVNFGKRKLYTGIVIELHNTLPNFEAKPILDLPDKYRFVNDEQLQLWNWMADYYTCMHGEILNSAIPGNLIPSSESKFYYNSNNSFTGVLSESENKIVKVLQESKKADVKIIIEGTDIKNPLKQLQGLQEKGIISINQQIVKQYKVLFKKIICFSASSIDQNIEEYEKILKRNSKQQEMLKFLLDNTSNENSCEIEEKLLLQKCNAGKASLLSLETKGFVSTRMQEQTRFADESSALYEAPVLADFQDVAYKNIKKELVVKNTVLLHGVTSSGKTEIYIKLIEDCLADGKQALYLLPEIALTTQIIHRLRKYFGSKVGVFHSRYPINNRSEVYKSLLNHELQIILGVRSSIFLPFDNLGLIVVDEEHESSYKQYDPDPRYNARDMAVVLSKIHKCGIVLGSATPSIESYSNAVNGKYTLIELNQRYGNVKMPLIEVVDIKDGYKRKIMQEHFHPTLVDNIAAALENKEQIILFQNRRGYAPNLECKDCGWVPYCNSCNVSLTYHRYENKLVCHYCGEKSMMPSVCDQCGGSNLATKGLGTQRIEEEAQNLFPQARIDRLDYDTASSRKRFENIIKNFENHNVDILIGTQMVTKGLDFANLTLVGILNADNMLNFPDFRAFERSYQLLAQVSGRAGRREKQGKVIIQTYSPEHPIIKQVIENDYKLMFKIQSQERTVYKYPPFWNFIIIKLKNKDKHKVYAASNMLANLLKKDFHKRVIGPEEPLINKISHYFILNIHIRFEKNISASKVKAIILSRVMAIKNYKELNSTMIDIDVDPM